MKQNDATDTFIKKLKKVNAESIKKAISRDLYNKNIKLKQLADGLREITTHGGSKRKEMEVKEKRLKGLREEM
jgi:aldehyde:ferredoxin oxidoreductase